MKVRQEGVVFGVAAVVLGWMTWSELGTAAERRGRRTASTVELERAAAPDLGVARPAAASDSRLSRALFDEPSDTRPLPPLPFVEPPREPLLALAPPTWPAPRAAHFAPHLWERTELREAPGLFDEAEGAADAAEGLEEPAADEGAAPAAAAPLTASERAALEEGYRRRFDWIELQAGRPLFGRIANADRYALSSPERASEAVLFEELVPETGGPRHSGQPPIAFERARVAAWGLADTLENRLELAFRALDGSISASNYPAALALASDCLDAAYDVPRALVLAESLYAQAIAHDPEDPAPRLGLARRHELAYEFTRAFEAYDEAEARFAHRGEVHVARGRLEARLLLDEAAEASFQRALKVDSGHAARLAYGSFLLERRRSAEALPLLEAAFRAAPQGPDERDVRLELRLALAAALAAEGRLGEAFDQHLAAWRGAPESQRALAGVLSLATRLPDRAGTFDPPAWLSGQGPAGAQPGALGFELLVAAGAAAAASGDAERARTSLEGALDADPLRAAVPLSALSFLAETHGHGDAAVAFVERALEADPHEPWALFQRARLAAERGDLEGAAADLDAALAVEADFADALAWRGELAWRRGDFAEAERYLERAVELAPVRADLFELRALCLVQTGAFLDARDAADQSLAREPERFGAKAVAAWCSYRLEGAGEALVRLGELEDSLRALDEADARRTWAREQIARIDEHRRRFAWTEGFERTRLENQWSVEDTVGQTVGLEQGELVIAGPFSRAGESRVWREYPAEELVSLELDVLVEEGSSARVAVFLGRESGRAGPRQVQSQIAIARNRDGAAQSRVVRGTTGAEQWIDLPSSAFPAGRWVRVRIERDGEGSDSTAGVALDGIPVLERVRIPGLGRASTPLRVGISVEGETGRTARVRVDNVEVVRRLER